MYNISLSFWIMFGLAWVANLIANSQELYRDVGEELVESDDEDNDDASSHGTDALTNGQSNKAQETPESTKVGSYAVIAS